MEKFGILVSIAAVIATIYLTGCVRNEPPVIETFAPDPVSDTLVNAGDTLKILCQASDPDGDSLVFELEANAGDFVGAVVEGEILWVAPFKSADVQMVCTVCDSDTLNPVADTLYIAVQNYFPMAIGNRWVYEGAWLTEIITMEIEVTSIEYPGKRWHITRTFDHNIPQDTLSYYEIVGDSVYFYDGFMEERYLALLLPLWVGKTWSLDGKEGSVEEKRDRGTDAGNFYECMRVELKDIFSSGDTLTQWTARDAGLIIETVTFPVLLGSIEFELVDYELN